MDGKMFTVKEAAEFLGITRQQMYNIVNNGRIKYQKIGYIKISEGDLLEYLDNIKESAKEAEGTMSVKEAAEYLSVSVQKMYNIIRSGEIESKCIRSQWLIDKEVLCKYREERTYGIERR